MYNNTSNAYALYQQNSILTAPREKLLIMLYDGAIKFLKLSKTAIDERNIEKANNNIIKAQNIISELMATLNMDYEISKSLFSLYDYMKHRLAQANIKKDKEIVDEVISMLSELKETWESALKQLK